jgi:Zn-dependent alcohol dehydrogenase
VPSAVRVVGRGNYAPAMRAIVFDGSGLVLTHSLQVREPGPGEVLVRMLASGICHSDLNVVDGASPRPVPIVLGHEGACEVVALGPGVTDANGLHPGDRAVIATITPCRACRACDAGRLSDCAAAFGTGERPFTHDGVPAGRYANSSTWAEHVVVKAEQLFGIGDLSPRSASLLGCAVSTGYGNVVNVARVQPGDTVAVIGIGGIGANVLQAARIAGAARIVALDIHESRRATAERFGATDVVIAGPDDDLVAAVRDLTDGGVDHAFECAGVTPTVEAAIAMTAPGGTTLLIGMPPRGTRVSVELDPLFRGRRIVGSLNGACDPARDFPAMIALARRGALELDALVTEVYPLASYHAAIAATRSGRVIRSVLDFTA